MKRPFFRTGDKVMVHNPKMCSVDSARGRVVCDNRQNKYGLTLVVLYEAGAEQELIETFTAEGKRLMPSDHCHLTLGWNEQA